MEVHILSGILRPIVAHVVERPGVFNHEDRYPLRLAVFYKKHAPYNEGNRIDDKERNVESHLMARDFFVVGHVEQPLMHIYLKLYSLTPQFFYMFDPPRLGSLRRVFCGAVPCGAHLESRKPENAPSQLCIHIARQKAHEKRRGAARHDNARCFAAKEAVPKNRAVAVLGLDVAEGRARKPRAIEKTFEDRGHTYPPHRVENNEVIAVVHELAKLLQIGLELLPLPIPSVQYRIKLHLPDIHPHESVSRFARA